MMTWVERHEKLQQHASLIARQKEGKQDHGRLSMPIRPPKPAPHSVKMARIPSVKAAHFNVLTQRYGAVQFQDALVDFIAQINHPKASGTALKTFAADTLIPFHAVPIYHKIKFISNSTSKVIDAVHIWPEQRDTRGRVIPSWFDTVVVRGCCQGTVHGNNGMFECLAQVFI